MSNKKKYSAAQRKAYQSGIAYAIALKGKRIDFKSEENKASFKAGLEKGKQKAAKCSARKGGKK